MFHADASGDPVNRVCREDSWEEVSPPGENEVTAPFQDGSAAESEDNVSRGETEQSGVDQVTDEAGDAIVDKAMDQ